MTNRGTSYRHAESRAAFWAPVGYDGETHYRTVLAAVLSASAILLAAAVILNRLLSA
jgi:hypothetical protein